MKSVIGFIFSLSSLVCWTQQPYEFIPRVASIVLSVNNVALLQKVSLDDLIQYDFMIDMQQELFDGSAKGKTIKDIGINFDQKLSVFYGRTQEYELSGFAFGVEDTAKLLAVFRNFYKTKTEFDQIKHYVSLFNHLIVKGNCALLFRLEALNVAVTNITDSIWIARGNQLPPDWEVLDFADQTNADLIDFPIDNVDEKILEVETEEDRNQQRTFSDSTEEQDLVPQSALEDDEPRDLVSGKSFWELLDSVTVSRQEVYFTELMRQLFSEKQTLVTTDTRFAQQLQHHADAIFYLDNSRNIKRNADLWYAQTLLPYLYDELSTLYTDNVILGDIYLNDQNIDFSFTANYGEELGLIYQSLTDAKLDKNMLKYIPKDCANFFSYKVNLQKAYQQTYDLLIPILEKEKNVNISMRIIALELLDELIDKKALFGMYQGSLFGTFNGTKTITTHEFVYHYDDQTWEYFEEMVERERQIPIFTLGLSTERPDIIAKILTRFSRITNQVKKEDNYWMINDAIAENIPLYILLQNGLCILTNDENLAKLHAQGYGRNAISGKKIKLLQKNGFMYVELNSEQLTDLLLSSERFADPIRQQQATHAMKDKTGTLCITSSKTTSQKTDFHATYTFDGQTYANASKYILDFINSLYIVAK